MTMHPRIIVADKEMAQWLHSVLQGTFKAGIAIAGSTEALIAVANTVGRKERCSTLVIVDDLEHEHPEILEEMEMLVRTPGIVILGIEKPLGYWRDKLYGASQKRVLAQEPFDKIIYWLDILTNNPKE